MRRSDALSRLSRDHHHGLVAAQRLSRATEQTSASARDAFLEFWAREGHEHFRDEEALLLPAYARHGSVTHEAVVRALTEHVDLRRRAADLAAGPVALDEMQELGRRLHDHIRHEERVLFVLVEEVMPADELDRFADELEAAEQRRAG